MARSSLTRSPLTRSSLTRFGPDFRHRSPTEQANECKSYLNSGNMRMRLYLSSLYYQSLMISSMIAANCWLERRKVKQNQLSNLLA
jgi:hypothetical protein